MRYYKCIFQLFRTVRPTAVIIFTATLLVTNVYAQQPTSTLGSYAELPGVRIWYQDAGGNGVPVVFLHAGSGSSQVWEHQIPAFTAAGYRFIAYDRRGWGRSVVDLSGPQPGTAADDLEQLMDYLKVEQCHIVATAAGGTIAWDFALSYPQRVRSMVIANNTGRVEDKAYREVVSSLRPEIFDQLPVDFRELGPAYRAANPEGVRRWKQLQSISRPDGPHMQTQPLKNSFTFALLEMVETPVLLIAGGADLLAPAPLLRYFTERVTSAESLVVPDGGHSIFWEQPEVFNRAVLEFIGKN